MTRIKRNKFGMGILVAFICLCAVGCHDSGGDQDMQMEAISETEEGLYISNTAPEKCYLCGTPEQSLLPFYEGQTNLGIISLNTFEFVPIEINRYDDYGNLVEEPAGFSSTSMQNTGENGFTAYVTPNHDRGYANATIYFENDKELNIDKAADFLCTECLNQTLEECWNDDPFGMGVINFETEEIRLLERNITAFTFDDFYVSCDLRTSDDSGGDSHQMDLLIFYCPERYQ